MNNILVVNINWLGDAVFSTPVFKALKAAYPQARVSCLCVPRVKEVLEHCPYVDKIIVYDEKGKHRMPWGQLQLMVTLRKQKFDAAFLLHRSVTRSMMVFAAGIPLRIGYGKLKFLLTHPVAMNAEDIHRSDYYLKVLEAYRIKIADRSCELRLKAEDVERLDAKLKKVNIGLKENYIILNTGGNWDLKRWSTDSFVLLAKRLRKEFGLKIILPGSSKDRQECEYVAKNVGDGLVVMAGSTSLGESLALYKRAKVVISADSGPLHLAHSVGADVIGIFGATRQEITGPRGQGRSQILFKDVGCNKAPCYHLSCSNNVCMQSVTVDDVFQAFQKFCA
jgi:heptosyltransferase-2